MAAGRQHTRTSETNLLPKAVSLSSQAFLPPAGARNPSFNRPIDALPPVSLVRIPAL